MDRPNAVWPSGVRRPTLGKKNNTPKEPQEKAITGSGADVDTRQQAAEHADGKVKCKCIVPCVWRGYRDEGDTVWIEKELVEKDAFIRAHFKAVEPLPEGQRRQDGDEGGVDGTRSQATEHDDNSDDEGETAADGEGQGELDLK